MRSLETRLATVLTLVALLASAPSRGQDATPPSSAELPSGEAPLDEPDPDPWPRVKEDEEFLVKIHPPQVDEWNGRLLRARAAVEIVEKGREGSSYGVVRFSARTRADKEARLVVVDEYQSVSATIPARDELQSRILGFLQKQLNDTVRIVSLDRLETALAASETKKATANVEVANDPPVIRFAQRPTLLVTVDGTPVWRDVEDTSCERLLNTRPLLLKCGGRHYLHLFDGWLEASDLDGPWKVSADSPSDLEAAMKKSLATQQADLLSGGVEGQRELDENGEPIQPPTLATGPVPGIVVATEPTEIIVTDGEPAWVEVPGTGLEFVENTSGNVFRIASSNTRYVLLSGRWFAASSLDGRWEYVPQSELPGDFSEIPDDSPKENVKASVAGTEQAAEALIANSIPQTSEIDRKGAEFSPEIDGDPEWKAIEQTPLSYVVNSPTPIIRTAQDTVYALYDAVWFVAPGLAGPWITAVHVPEVVYTIPANSPLHYVTYVRIYDSNEEKVVVGYTPGYYGTVVNANVVVYGTGYVYRPWIGRAWYAYPATWGFGCGITYSPWAGWSFTFGIGWGWGYWGSWYAPYYPPYWGPYWGYRPWYGGAAIGPRGGWAAWGPGGWAGTTGNIYRHWGPVSTVSRYSAGFNAWTGNAYRGKVGTAYNSRTGTIAAGQRGAVGNIYTGEYAYGSRGVAQRPGTGTTVGGSRVTFGDVDTGRQGTAGRVGAVNPGTGQSGSAGWVRGDDGALVRVGDDYYAGKNGQVYKRNQQGDWSQIDRSGQWKGVQDPVRTQDLSRQHQARSYGSQRYQGYRSSVSRAGGYRRGGGRRR